MIMLQAIASSHGVEPVRNGTALAITKATLRAQVYSAMLRTSSAVLKAAAIENPRLIAALTAVTSAQKRNGMFIEHRLLPARTLCVLIVTLFTNARRSHHDSDRGQLFRPFLTRRRLTPRGRKGCRNRKIKRHAMLVRAERRWRAVPRPGRRKNSRRG